MHSRLDKAASSAGHSLSHPARHQTPAAYSGVHVPADDNTSLPSPVEPSAVLLSRLMRRPVRASAPLAMSRILTAAFWMHQMHVNGQLLAACQVPESQNPARSGLGCSVCMYMHTVDTSIQRSQGEGGPRLSMVVANTRRTNVSIAFVRSCVESTWVMDDVS